MSEEQIPESEEAQPEVQPEVQPREKTPQDSPLFKALYEAAEEPIEQEPAEEVVPEEPRAEPHTLNEALDLMGEDEEIEEGEVEQQLEEEPTETQVAVENPKKSQPKKKKIKQVIDPDLPEQPKFEEPAFSKPDEDPDEEYVKTLLPEEQEIYSIAKYASKNMDEYKGADEELKTYFNKSKAYIERRLKEDPHVDLRQDQEYKTFMAQNRPRFNQNDVKKVEKEMIITEAESRAERKSSLENRRLKHELERIKREPVVQQAKQTLRKAATNIIPEEFREKLSTQEGLESLAKENPFEYQIMDGVAGHLTQVSDTFIDITTGMEQYNPNNPTHKRLLEWVDEEQNNFIQSGQTQKDGKVFMRRERYHQLSEDKRAKYFTWSDDDLLGLLMARAQQRLENDLNAHRQALQNAGYTRANQPVPQPQQVSQPVAKQEPPRATSAPRPGGITTQKANPKTNAMLNILGM
jgi:hypothetical protein